MRYPPLSPSIDAGARVVFETLAATVEVESRPDRQALFPRYAAYYAFLSRLRRRTMGLSNTEQKRNSGLISAGLAMLLVLAAPLAYAQFPPPPDPSTTTTTLPTTTTSTTTTTTTLPPPTTSSTTTTTLPPTTTSTTTTTTLPTTTTTLVPPPPPPTADLALSLTGTPAFLTVNGQLTYTITVTNNGPGPATGVRVEDSRPPGATVLEGPASSSQGECRGTVTVVCDLGMLAAGAEATVTINVIPLVTGDLSSAANVTAVEIDPDHANNSGTETTTVEPEEPARADLAITAVAEVNPRASDQGFTYTLTVKNDGPATATGVQLTNDLPRAIDLDQITVSQANCRGTDPVLCDLGALPSGATETVTIDVIRTEVGTLPNRAAVNGDQHDPNRGNNFALTSALDLPTPRTTCNGTRCSLRLTCNLSDLLERSCDNQVRLFVDTRARRDTRALRLSDERAARGPRLVPFAAVSRNFPGDQTTNVRLKLTRKGKKLARTLLRQGIKQLRGEMRISNHVGAWAPTQSASRCG